MESFFISKECGITEGRAKDYKLYFLYATVHKSAKRRTTEGRHRKCKRTREHYRNAVKVSQEKIIRIAELKKQGKTIPQIANIIGTSRKTVSNYWKKDRESGKD